MNEESKLDAADAVEQRLDDIARRLGDVIADTAGAHSRSKTIRPDHNELVSIIREIAGYTLNADVCQFGDWPGVKATAWSMGEILARASEQGKKRRKVKR